MAINDCTFSNLCAKYGVYEGGTYVHTCYLDESNEHNWKEMYLENDRWICPKCKVSWNRKQYDKAIQLDIVNEYGDDLAMVLGFGKTEETL